MNKKLILNLMLFISILLTDNYKALAESPPIIGPTYVCPNQSFSFYTLEGADPNAGEFYQWCIRNSSQDMMQMQALLESYNDPEVSLPYFIINPLPAGTYTLSFQICTGYDGCTGYDLVTIHVGTTGVLPNTAQLCGDLLPSADGYNPAYPSFMAQTSYSAGTSAFCNNSPTYYYSNLSGGNYTYIHSGVSIGMHAGSFINLNPGFTAENGATFLASITTTCPTGGNLRMADGFESTLSQPQINTASTIYPNPSNGIFTVNPKPGESVKALTVLNSLGSIIYSNAIVTSKFQGIPVDISSATSAIYYLKIDYESGKIDNQKIIIQ